MPVSRSRTLPTLKTDLEVYENDGCLLGVHIAGVVSRLTLGSTVVLWDFLRPVEGVGKKSIFQACQSVVTCMSTPKQIVKSNKDWVPILIVPFGRHKQ